MKQGVEMILFIFPRAETAGGMDSHVLKKHVGLSTWDLLQTTLTVLRPHITAACMFIKGDRNQAGR